MEKRLILFFLSVALTMIVFQYFFAPRQVARPAGASPDTLAHPATQPAVPTSWEGLVQAGVETLHVATEWLSLTLTSGPGSMVSCHLPQFEEGEGEPVKLFPPGYRGALALQLRYATGDSLIPCSMEVTSDPDSLHAYRVVWSSSSAGGWVRKVLDVPRRGYACRLTLESGGSGVAGFTLAIPPGLKSTERNHRDDLSYFAAMAGVNGHTWKHPLGKPKGPSSTEGLTTWMGLRTKYFLVAAIPDTATWHRITATRDEGKALGITWESVASGGRVNASYTLYMGPLDYDQLAPLGSVVHAVEMGNRYLRPIGRLVLLFLTTVYKAIPNYGVVIVLFAITMKILLHPLTASSTKSMKKMQELQPKIEAIKEKYKNNAQRQQQEIMKLYKEHGINPLGGCLPILLQMPIFFAMYPVLRSSIHLRRAVFIGGFINDLSQPNIVLPILMGITQFISGKMMATDKQNKALAYLMPIFMTYIFFQLPSGLVLYWLTFNVLQIGQQVWQKRKTARLAAS